MYKTILSLSAFFLSSYALPAQAQMADRFLEHPTFSMASLSKAASDDAVIVTREMSNRLRLNEGQFVNLLPLNRTRLASLKLINHEYQEDAATRSAKIEELEAQYEQACSRILTPSQLSQLQLDNDKSTTAPATSGHGLG